MDARDKLMHAALLAFSDSCTIPNLTPTCPFYRTSPSGAPTCAEECRDLANSLGLARPTVTVEVDGLRMTGAKRPLSVAQGATLFDATELLISDMGAPAHQASTTALLLRLRNLAATPPNQRDRDDMPNLIGELESRGIIVNDILREACATTIAAVISESIDTENGVPGSSWSALWVQYRDLYPWSDIAGFQQQLKAWFTRLAETSRADFFAWKAPPLALLGAVTPATPDPVARWIWERFTLTYLNDWSTSSLVLEWDYARGTPTDYCEQRVLSARHVDPATVGEAALERLAKRSSAPRSRSTKLEPDGFVDRAAELLRHGRPDEAADIFLALAAMYPTDGDSLNSLGFCLVPSTPERAIGPLDRAARLSPQAPDLNAANRAFVRHLLGRNDEAEAILSALDPPSTSVLVWVEGDVCGSFTLRSEMLDTYISELLAHVRESRDRHVD